MLHPVPTGMVPIKPLPLASAAMVGRPRAARLLALALALLLAALPVAMLFVPWQQSVPGSGRVSAVDPLDRIQTIPAPVSGRLADLRVQEGSVVRKGDVLAEMEDLAQGLATRLQQQLQIAVVERESAHGQLESLDARILQLVDEREFALQSARSELKVAIEAVNAERAVQVGLRADREQKETDYRRKQRLLQGGAKSTLEFQEAAATYEQSKSKVEASIRRVDQLLAEEEARAVEIDRIAASMQAKINKARADRNDAEQKLQQIKKKVNEAEIAFDRQATQTIYAPRDGTVLRIHGATSADLISRGQRLIDFMPDTDELAIEFWVRGVDAPLVTPGRKVRLVFEGWPAVQVAGWPSVAVGTFGGIVQLSDAHAGPDGRVRVLVTPDGNDAPWPERPFLRQGVRVSGWVQLDTVSAGYEVWRQLNAFPPSVNGKPDRDADVRKQSDEPARGSQR